MTREHHWMSEPFDEECHSRERAMTGEHLIDERAIVSESTLYQSEPVAGECHGMGASQ